jgi:hypothetical protein
MTRNGCMHAKRDFTPCDGTPSGPLEYVITGKMRTCKYTVQNILVLQNVCLIKVTIRERAQLNNLTIAQLVKEFPTFHATRNFISFQNRPYLESN